jgi:hypothetical protein
MIVTIHASVWKIEFGCIHFPALPAAQHAVSLLVMSHAYKRGSMIACITHLGCITSVLYMLCTNGHTAVLYMSAAASLCKHQPPIIY